MQYIVTAKEMKALDSAAIEKIGLNALVLMERAALSVWERIRIGVEQGNIRGKNAIIFCGSGNNGADGLALARLLKSENWNVEIILTGSGRNYTEQWITQKSILEYYEPEFNENPQNKQYSVIVDAMLGVGTNREIEGALRERVHQFNELEGYHIAMDIPTGVCTDTGKILGTSVYVEETVTFAYCKRGLVLYPGCERAGKVTIADIGIPHVLESEIEPKLYTLDEKVKELLPPRKRDGNKGTFGKVLIIAGSYNMAGAAALSAKAAYRTGAGMVKVITIPENREIIQKTVPEALLGTPDDLCDSMDWADVIAIGPGIGKEKCAKDMLKTVIEKTNKPLLVDADGLNILSEDIELQNIIKSQCKAGRFVVFAPHVGELSRLKQICISELKTNYLDAAMDFSNSWGVTLVAKDARTYICCPNEKACINLTGNSGMATAGSGDVLAGIIIALMGQGLKADRAACIGVYLHGQCGDLVAREKGEIGCMAGDIAEKITEVVLK